MTETYTQPAQIPIHEALNRVMQDVQVIEKADRTEAQGKYQYRGVDRVLNECGPAFRRHGVIALPIVQSWTSREVATSRDKSVHEVIVHVVFQFVGPTGDMLECSVIGESTDASDKASAQAMSVALRTAYLQALSMPTGDPDPDEHAIERGSGASSKSSVSAEDTKAKADGWPDTATRLGAWKALLAGQRDLDDDFKKEILDWGHAENLTEPTFTKAQAERWQELLDAARAKVAEATTAGEEKVRKGFADPDGKESERQKAAMDDDPMTDPF